jgi:BirA family biotin operon repressor/biotin-[acetyl-CoA-carboxylase] ligase
MGFVLAPSASLAGYRLEAHDRVGSTNTLAVEAARAGDPGNLWIVSKRQETGRGRRGRAWQTPEGNLAATLLARSDFDPRLAATLGFVAGLALSDALAAVVPGSAHVSIAADGGGGTDTRFTLKWPNDVLAEGRKLAGILLESALFEGERFAVAIGIGVNVVAHPADLPYPATSLAAMGARCDAETLFLALSDAWMNYVHQWDNGRGLGRIRRLWLARAAGLGGEVAVRIGERVVRGIFETIDEECRFVIRDAAGVTIPVAAGDVHFGAVASERAE